MEKAKLTAKALNELTEIYAEACITIKSTAKVTAKTKKLWREGNKSNLIRIGIACIVFPDPSPISEIVGAGFLVAGAVQKGIQNRTMYVGDIKKNLENTIRELGATQGNMYL